MTHPQAAETALIPRTAGLVSAPHEPSSAPAPEHPAEPPLCLGHPPMPKPLGSNRVQNDLEDLGNQIANLAAQITAASYRLLVMIAEFDERGGWADWRSCAHWLNWRIGLRLGAAREKVRVARRLRELPLVAGGMECGELSYSKVRAITRVAAPETEATLVGYARVMTAAQLERVCRSWRRVSRRIENEHDEVRRKARELSTSWDEDGMLVVRARLEPEVGAAFLQALEAAGDALFEEDRKREEAFEERVERVGRAQRRADALGVVAEWALSGGASARASESAPARAGRYQVVVHVDEPVLASCSDGQSTIENGPGVSAETSRRLACDAGVVEMRHGVDGSVLDVGRKRRTVPPAIRRALEHRDGGCCFPGCGVKHCEAHHIEHWADGGATSLDNLVLLCRFHHRALHEGGFSMGFSGGQASFYRPNGQLIPSSPPVAAVDGGGVGRLCRDNLRCGHHIDRYTMPLWNGDRLDLGMAIDGLVGKVEPRKRARRARKG